MDLLNFTINLTLKSGKILKDNYGSELQVETKTSYRDMVTKVDKESETLLVNLIKEQFPDHEILGEEGISNSKTTHHKIPSTNYKWIIDPLDGTANYTRNIPFFAVSIGIEKNEEMIIGVIYNPIANQIFFAEKGKGAFLAWNQAGELESIEKIQKIAKKMHVSKIPDIKNAVLGTGFIPSNRRHLKENLELFSYFSENAQAIRRMGAASLDLAFVAAGFFDGFWEYDLCPWDVAAGSILIKEAGGRVTNYDGSKFDLNLCRILATNGLFHEEMIEKLKNRI